MCWRDLRDLLLDMDWRDWRDLLLHDFDWKEFLFYVAVGYFIGMAYLFLAPGNQQLDQMNTLVRSRGFDPYETLGVDVPEEFRAPEDFLLGSDEVANWKNTNVRGWTFYSVETPNVDFGCSSESTHLKVFMYDLPSEFHYGMLRNYTEGQIWPRSVLEIPEYPGDVHKQHSPEYWLTTDLLTSNMWDRRSKCTGFRVRDWKDADVVFVPFFASLAFFKYGMKSSPDRWTTQDVNMNEELQKKLVTFLKSQPAWQASGGYNHVFVTHHPNSMHLVQKDLDMALFVVGNFRRNIGKDVLAPYVHAVHVFADDNAAVSFELRRTLLFYRDAIYREEGGDIVREQLYELLKDEPDVNFEPDNTTDEDIHTLEQGMRSSRFCLHLAGDSPSSVRLFDAIASHCVPVIISDDIELPYEDTLDYSEFCIFILSSKALQPGFVIGLLRSVTVQQWTRRWERLRQVEQHFEYQHPTQPGDAVNMVWEAIARKVPAMKFLIHHTRHSKGTPHRNLIT